MNSQQYIEAINKITDIPDDYQLAQQVEQKRNRKKITVIRLQAKGVFTLNGPRIIAVFDKDKIISFKNYRNSSEGRFLSHVDARQKAENNFAKFLPQYAKRLSFMRIDYQSRKFIMDGQSISIPIQWVKFAHAKGSFNWMAFDADGQLIEFEVESYWDFFRGRRKTEMWDNDDWVLARQGKGPQLSSPNALA